MSDTPLIETPDDNDREGTRRMDPELRTLSAIIRLLESLDLPARTRAVCWLTSRYSEEQP